jgi:NAD(P)-dependent dehydrogenase (short-subunit alcohol dehydrogenase family)
LELPIAKQQKVTDSEPTRTHLFIGKPDTEENRKGFVATIPLGRPSTPADIANACTYLASDEANFITGVDLQVDGGRCV